jgi:hypothetical protein
LPPKKNLPVRRSPQGIGGKLSSAFVKTSADKSVRLTSTWFDFAHHKSLSTSRRLSEFSRGDFFGKMRSDYFKNTAPEINMTPSGVILFLRI